jgi:hypothetical protein
MQVAGVNHRAVPPTAPIGQAISPVAPSSSGPRMYTETETEYSRSPWFPTSIERRSVTRRTRFSKSAQDGVIQRRDKYLIPLPFFASRIEFAIERSSLSPVSYSLQFEHELSQTEHRDLFLEVCRTFQRGSLFEAQRLLTDRKITLSTRLHESSLWAVSAI